MTITGAIVLYAILWFLTLYIVLPQKLETQGDVEDVVPGTPASAPTTEHLRKKFLWTTVIATAAWAGLMAIVLSGVVSLDDIDLFGAIEPEWE